MNGTDLKAEYLQCEGWKRDALVMKAAFHLDLLHAELEHKNNMLRMAQECGEAWRNLYRDSWRSAVRTWVNGRDLEDQQWNTTN